MAKIKKAKSSITAKKKIIKRKATAIAAPLNYDHKKVETKWQKHWLKTGLNKTQDQSKKPKHYVLDMFPYPSGDGLHVGHPKGYIATDIYSRFKKMNGFNVLHPMGWDAFGLPAENYAIKNKVHPKKAVEKNIKRYKEQLSLIGFNYDWGREINTTDPAYYKWTQWIFLQLYKKGLAYESFEPINWCPSCQTGLANEDVEDGKCERCGTTVEKKPMRQWVLRITDYADRLLKDLETLDWPKSIKESQKNWIGKSEGALIKFPLTEIAGEKEGKHFVEVFTTRPDTIFGVSFVAISPELAQKWLSLGWKTTSEVNNYITKILATRAKVSFKDDPEKTGILTGVYAINPANNEKIPVFITNYVLGDIGTGAVMGVPAHDERDFEFAKKYNLPIKQVVMPSLIDQSNPPQANRENTKRELILAIVYNPQTKKYLTLDWKKQGWTSFVTGGVEKGEDFLETAKREIVEETGYTKVKLSRRLGLTEAFYFAAHKNVNRQSFAEHFLFELENEDRVPVSSEESDAYEVKWRTIDELKKIKLQHAEADILLKKIVTGNDAYIDSGILINSDKFSGKRSDEAKKLITDFVGGKITTTYKLKDWVFSRQRYWGEPIPVVHCAKCSLLKHKKEARLTLNFNIQAVWKDLVDGIKTVETRALNPEEKNRYFGQTQVGDILLFVNKKTQEEKLYRVKSLKIFKTLKDLYEDKITLSKLSKKKYKNLEDLKRGYNFTADYLNRIENNGLIAWEIEPVTEVVPVPEKDLPIKLPEVKSYAPTGTGESPLADISKWVNTKCPVCKGPAKRETNTMPQWAGSSWYYLRFMDPKNNKALVDPKKEKYWAPVDMYVGGSEHATRHLIYARFWHKFLYDLKTVSTSEPFKRIGKNLGLILGADGRKMSKRWGNVINPDEVIKLYGADTLRVYEMFMGPFDQEIAWNTDSMIGSRRFLEKVWRLSQKVTTAKEVTLPKDVELTLHQTIKKVGEDIENFNFNTAVSTMMILTNQLDSLPNVPKTDYQILLQLLAPFAPHLTDELWSNLKNKGSIHSQNWPIYAPNKLESETATLTIQVNGKVRAQISLAKGTSQAEAIKAAKGLEEVKKWLNHNEIVREVFIPDRLINFVVKS